MFRPRAILLACLALAGGVIAGPPDFKEDFDSFDGIGRDDQSSPNDTGSTWRTFPPGPTSTSFGFQRDSNGLHGPCITWQGAEEASLIAQDPFPVVGGKPHMVCFGAQFSRATSGASQPDFAQVFSAVPVDANLLNQFFVNYVVGVGKLDTDTQGIVFFYPTSILGNFQGVVIPAPPDQWNLVVVQYDPSSDLVNADAAVRVWVNPTSPSDEPDLDIKASQNLVGSFFGNGPLGRFGMADTTDMTRGRADRAGTSTVKVDRVGGWQGYDGTRGAGSLSDAIDYLNGTSLVSDWQIFE